MMTGIEKAMVPPRAPTCLGLSIEGKVSKPVKTEMGEIDLQEMLGANKTWHCIIVWGKWERRL